MATFEVGDKVAVIHDTISGIIVGISDQIIEIEDQEGFTRRYKQEELSLAASVDQYKLKQIPIKEEALTKIKGVLKEDRSKLRRNEIDLHIEELIDYHADMTNHEILMKQMGACKRFVQRAIDGNLKRVVLIHGKGQGVLKTEIHTYLNKLSVYHEIKIEYSDAAYTEYGMGGATEVFLG